MNKKTGSGIMAVAIVLGLLVQVILGYAESVKTPAKAAIEFSKAYFMQDTSLKNYICGDKKQAAAIVKKFINKENADAQCRGFDKNYKRSSFFNIVTYTSMLNKDSALVRITGKIRKYHNPVFTVFAKIFNLGKAYDIDETLRVVKVKDGWKVCDTDKLTSL